MQKWCTLHLGGREGKEESSTTVHVCSCGFGPPSQSPVGLLLSLPSFLNFFLPPSPPHPTRCCYNCMELNHLPMIIIWAINYFFALLNQFSIFHSFPFPCFVVIKKTLIFYLIQRHEISKFCKRTIKDEPSYHLKKVLDWPTGKWTTGWSEIKIEEFWFLGEAEVPIND